MNDANQPNDPLHDGLHDQGLSSLYQQSKLDQPSMALDSAILQQARKAVAKKENKSWWQLNWLVPAATTAMILLAITVSWQNRDSAIIEETSVMTDSEQLQTAKQETPASEPESKQSREQARVAPAPMEMQKSKRLAAPSAARLDEAGLGEAEASLDMAAPVQQPAPQAETQTSSRTKKAQSGVERFAAKPMANRQVASEPAKDLADSINNEQNDPEAWLKAIEKLLQQGKLQQAREEFKAFRKRFPDYKVPEELLQKLSIKQ